ncbi:MAG: double-strand break repair protein AddB [Rhodospirillaceae bacterium]|nr:double-strand break repair protein AddB [Rhodospirillaceae bacterium]
MKSGRGAAIFTIPAGVSFVDALAAGLIDETGGDPIALARYRILLPTRRGCRSLRDAFLRASDGRPMLLPRLVPLGDVDEEELTVGGGLDADAAAAFLPPAIAPLRRQALLTKLVVAYYQRIGGAAPTLDQAALLAASLASLLDQVQTERLGFERLGDLVRDKNFAEHWNKILRFLAIVTESWPAILTEESALDPAERRNRLIDAQRELWERMPPADPVIVAGSTGSIPATADLIAAVAILPNGRIVLPGLDCDADAETWTAIAGDPTHPQHGLSLLLSRLEIAPRDVALWSARPKPFVAEDERQDYRVGETRARVIAEAMRPAATAERWQEAVAHFAGAKIDPERMRTALSGVTRIDAPTPADEAGAIALAMREVLETPGKRAALVTADRDLARRVAAALQRWDIDVDDSAGTELGTTPPGTFLRLLAEAAAQSLAPVPLLALLKHPLASGGMATARFRETVRAFERAALRGPRPAPGIAGLRAALGSRDVELLPFVDRLADVLAPLLALAAQPTLPLGDLVAAHLATAEALAQSDEQSGAECLWSGDAGEAAALFADALRDAAAPFPALALGDYAAVLSALMHGHVVRPGWGRHPRLAIWGPLEARLQHVDRMILGGLNERSWPPDLPADPWFSREMRVAFGLAPPERRIGLSAHDFAQGMAAPEVFLTRSMRVGGTPTVPARWLLRLDALLQACKIETEEIRDANRLFHAAALDRPPADEIRPCLPPAPTPPVEARPNRLSVTDIGLWMSDPYSLYAKRILKLKELEPLDAEPDAADRGNFVHEALDAFVRAYPKSLPANARDELIGFGEAAFGPTLNRPEVRAFWWPRFQRIVDWFLEREGERRGDTDIVLSETKATWEVAGLDFTLVASVDRIERGRDRRLVIADYKTGYVPKLPSIELGYAPQLTLEAAMARASAFGVIGDAAERDLMLEYWKLTGGAVAGRIVPVAVGDAARALAIEAEAGLRQLVARFRLRKTPYRSRPHPLYAPRLGAYDHLARVAEWSSAGSDGE